MSQLGKIADSIDAYNAHVAAEVARARLDQQFAAELRAKWAKLHASIEMTHSPTGTPLPRLALIVVDEEHDASYKQQDGLRYHARDVAVMRAHRTQVPVLLGSATPSLETLHNAQSGRYRHLRLLKRVRQQAPPRIHLLDVRHAPLDNGLSPTMLEAVQRQLEAGHQALLFLNRRGYAPVLLCHDCGAITPCPNCDARLVVHRARKRLACHHCGHIEAMPEACQDCGGKLVPVGQGTERIEDTLRLRFPEYRVERFDSDRLSSGAAIARLLAEVESGEVKLLVGTQVLAKGHDFAGLAFAGLIDIDQALFGADFRAIERMGQMVTQVAGRVGRADAPGEVLLQTHQPEHPLLRLLVEKGYAAFADTLMAERRQFGEKILLEQCGGRLSALLARQHHERFLPGLEKLGLRGLPIGLDSGSISRLLHAGEHGLSE